MSVFQNGLDTEPGGHGEETERSNHGDSVGSNKLVFPGSDHTDSCFVDQDALSPDVSLSSQHTLKYSDVESELTDHNKSHESSDSIEVLEDLPAEDSHTDINQMFFQQLTLLHNASEKRIEPRDKLDSCDLLAGPSAPEDSVSVDSHEVIPDFSNVIRPESLALHRPLEAVESETGRSKSAYRPDSRKSVHMKDHKDKDAENARIHSDSWQSQSLPAQEQGAHYIEPSGLSQSLPQGTITRKGDMIQFVADDLQAKIKQSSPLSHADSTSLDSRRSSVRSIASASSSTSFATSSGVSRSPSSQFQQSPDDIPPIDASAVVELENHAQRVADSLDLMMGNIRNNLHKMSAITIGCQEAYKRSVDITCDSVDSSIRCMYAMMAKCEELSTAMVPVENLAAQIKEIKRILELFESHLSDK